MKKEVIQNHHLIYKNEKPKQEELTLPVRKSVHFTIITKLRRFKNLTEKEIVAIEFELSKFKIKNLNK